MTALCDAHGNALGQLPGIGKPDETQQHGVTAPRCVLQQSNLLGNGVGKNGLKYEAATAIGYSTT